MDSAPPMYKHIASDHDDQLQARILLLQTTSVAPTTVQLESSDAEFTSRRAEKYESDPISLNCECDPSEGTVILFYAYLPINDPLALARLHKSWSQESGLCGKVRLANEGINATVAGSSSSISDYIDNLTSLPEFEPLNLTGSNLKTEEDLTKLRYNFFKPTSGCRHIFGESMSIKVVDEICPLGVPEMSVYHDVENKCGKLSPQDFHQKLKELAGNKDAVVLDVRNYYESSIGRFPGAITPQIRKFSSFRDYVDQNKEFEKATSYLRQSLGTEDTSHPTTVLMLDGGIHNYLEWIKHEGTAEESLWLVPDGESGMFCCDECHEMGDEVLHQDIGATCIYLASKTEESTRKFKDVIIACAQKAAKKEIPIDDNSKEFRVWKDTIIYTEEILLEALCFELSVEHPYQFMLSLFNNHYVEPQRARKLKQVAWAFINDSLRTTLCLLFPPKIVALGAIHIAARYLDENLNDGLGEIWRELYEPDIQDITDVANEIMDQYTQFPNKGGRSLDKMLPGSKPGSEYQENGTPSYGGYLNSPAKLATPVYSVDADRPSNGDRSAAP
ncbi:hypothetical protein BGZ76_003679 [Entomortierella beljakovae]|nr:hypothetical protein BGZ76_003679 [Entomortierella beljakovae]